VKILVQKYGGSSVASAEKIQQVAALIKARRDAGFSVCVVVSAMGKTTDALLAQAREVAADPPRRELDMLLTCGERASMALLAMALHELSVPAISFTGSQSGILTSDRHSDARILEVRPYRVTDELEAGRVVIVAGFQGVSYRREITTLGRGGSDTTAVALAAALDAEACEIYSDVDGVYTADPRVVPGARPLAELSYEEMQELAAAGAKVLNAQAVQFAKTKGIALYAKKTGEPEGGTVVRKGAPPPPGGVRGIAHKERLYSLVADDIARAPLLLAHLEACHIRPVQLFAQAKEGHSGGLFCLIAPDDAHGFERCATSLPEGCVRGEDRGAVSLVGEGLLEDARVASTLLLTLAETGIAVHGLSTSSFRVTALVPPEQVQAAARALHAHFLERERLEAV
jgi:aspartate kinase